MAATTTYVSVEEYLGTMYHPDCDYVEGELQERNMGEWSHAEFQAALSAYFFTRRKQWSIHVATELRIRVSHDRVRLPDICIVKGPRPTERVLTSPPFLCIEVLSPSDNLNRVRRRIADFLEFGVRYVWLIDPRTSEASVITAEGEIEVVDGILRAGEIEVPMTELYDA